MNYPKPTVLPFLTKNPRNLIARRLAVGFGSVSLVAIAMCTMLMALIAQVASLVTEMRGAEAGIKESLTLAIAVREQYAHHAHWLIERSDEHLDHSDRLLRKIETGTRLLRPLVPSVELARLDGVLTDSRALDELFADKIRPAANRGNRGSVVRGHQKALKISERATESADAIARAVEGGMAHSHVAATQATQVGLLVGTTCIVLVLGLSFAHTVRFRRAVVKPLGVLSTAAQQFGAGNFQRRLGQVGDGELRSLALAFDRMAEELEVRERKLVASERMAAIGQLAAGVAHEINNPIGIIRGYLKMIEPGSTPELFQEELSIIDDEAAACQRIAEDLVTFARASKVHREAIAMNQLVDESVRRFRESAEGREVEITLSTERGQAYAEAGRVRQVLLNLMTNAAQVSSMGGVVSVRGRVLRDGGYGVTVEDSGPGIEEENLSRIFEPFFGQRRGGSGLGLAVCQGIIQAHGGSLRAYNRPSGGAKFEFTLPPFAPQVEA